MLRKHVHSPEKLNLLWLRVETEGAECGFLPAVVPCSPERSEKISGLVWLTTMGGESTDLPAPSCFALLSDVVISIAFGMFLPNGFVCAGAELGFFFSVKRSASISSISCWRARVGQKKTNRWNTCEDHRLTEVNSVSSLLPSCPSVCH